MKRASLALCATLLMTGGAAHAQFTISGSAGLFSTEPGNILIADFDVGYPVPGLALYGGGARVAVPGLISDVSRQPADDATPYFHVGAGGTGTIVPGGGSATVSSSGAAIIYLATDMVYFGLYVGSPDSSNLVEFYNNGDFIKGYSGTAILAAAFPPGSVAGADIGHYVNFKAAPGVVFDQVVLRSVVGTSPVNAFESDNHAVVAIPEPGPYAMLLAGIAMLGFIARRRMQG